MPGAVKFSLRISSRPSDVQLLRVQVKLNTDECPTTATDYGIRSIPTVMIFKGGQKLDTIIGAVPKDVLLKTINKFID